MKPHRKAYIERRTPDPFGPVARLECIECDHPWKLVGDAVCPNCGTDTPPCEVLIG